MTPTGAALVKAALDSNDGPIPRYGSAEFDTAAPVMRAASVALAAEAWLQYCSTATVEADMRRAVATGRRAWLRDMADAYRAGQESVKEVSLDAGKALPELAKELGELDQARRYRARMLDTAPRANDYQGRRQA